MSKLVEASTLILNSTYYGQNKDSIQIGLFHEKGYEPFIRIVASPPRTAVNSCRQHMKMGILLPVTDYFELTKLDKCINALFTTNTDDIISNYDNNTVISLSKLLNPEGMKIGKYSLTFEKYYKLLRIRTDEPKSTNVSYLNITHSFWLDLTKLRPTIGYKFKMLDCYKKYAQTTHRKIVRFYVNYIMFEGKREWRQIKKNEITYNYLENSCTQLKQRDLPNSIADCNYNFLDKNICLMIDAEIRVYSISSILKDIHSNVDILRFF